MLCPVCKKKPLTGRQTRCSAACRSAPYRTGKQQQRDTSQSAAAQEAGEARARSSQRQRRSDVKRLERLVSAATDKTIEAIQRQPSPSMQQAHEALRVELRDQVTSQAPKGAIGHRLVLPGRGVDDPPRLSPKRSRERDVAWYSLVPFEYPDDIRLRDGCWYRILWIDGQGQRIRKPATAPSPALYFFLGRLI